MKTVAFLLLLGSIACGGAVATIDDAGGDGGPTGDAAVVACPHSAPPEHTSCPLSGLRCEYGADPNPACNQVYQCGPGTGWLVEPYGACAKGTCAATYASVPQNQDCTTNGLTCAYPEGECICTQDFGGPVRQTPGWFCIAAQSGCPSPRPDIGSACSTPDAQCDYGACSGGVGLSCTDGRWQESAVTCPD